MKQSKKSNLQDYIEYIYNHLERTKDDKPNHSMEVIDQLFPDAKNINEREILNFIRENKIADRFLEKYKRVHPVLPQNTYRIQGSGHVRMYSLDILGKIYLDQKLNTTLTTNEILNKMGVPRSLLCYIPNITKEYNRIIKSRDNNSKHVENYVKRSVQKSTKTPVTQETIAELVNSFTQLIQALTKAVK